MQTLRSVRSLRVRAPGPALAPFPVLSQARLNSTAASAFPSKKKKPSPYRIPKLDAFREAFDPLAAAGWRLAATSSSAVDPASEAVSISDPLELEARRLVQSYHFAQTEYGRLLDMMTEVGRVVKDQDVS